MPQSLYGNVNENVVLEALVAKNTEGDPLAYIWSFGDGTVSQFPSHDPVTAHTYDNYYYAPNDSQVFMASVSVTDGVNPPIYHEFQVYIDPNEVLGVDEWSVDVNPVDPEVVADVDLTVTFENHDGALVAVEDVAGESKLAYGIEFAGIIFWMELWMDLEENAFWGERNL